MSIITTPLSPALPVNGQVIDATALDASINSLIAQVNANAQPSSGGPLLAQWQPLGVTGTFISSTSFSVPGNYTSILSKGLKLQTSNTGGTSISAITTATFGAGITTVNVIILNAINLDSGLSTINFGVLSPNNFTNAVPQNSIVQVLWQPSAVSFTTNVLKVASTTNGFLASVNLGDSGGLFGLSGEFSTSTGIFTPTRAGYYHVSFLSQIGTTGVTFNGACSIGNGGGGTLGGVTNGFSAGLQANNAFALTSYVDYFGGTGYALGMTLNFSAGSPTFVQGWMTVVGPLP